MSFEKTAFPITFTDLNDLSEHNYPLTHVWAPTHLIAKRSSGVWYQYKTSYFASSNHTHDSITGVAGYITMAGTTGWWNQSSGQIQIQNPETLTFINQIRLQTVPTGRNCYIYADGFVEWSMARLKTDIVDIPDSIGVLKKMKASKYKVLGKESLGLVVEKNPQEVVETADVDGMQEKGVNLSSVVSILLDVVQKQEARITVLEGLVKEVKTP